MAEFEPHSNVRPGRPRRRPPPTDVLLTRRIRHLVDVAHEGNLSDACRLTAVSYPTLSQLYSGSSVAPNLSTLQAMATPYGLDTAWFVDRAEPASIPVLGKLGLIPPALGDRGAKRSIRQVLIPFAAWPMFELLRSLESRLQGLDATPERPIVGEAKGDAFTFRLTTFLLQPLLSAEKLGLATIPAAQQASENEPTPHSFDKEWIAGLRAVAETWDTVLRPLLLSGPSS